MRNKELVFLLRLTLLLKNIAYILTLLLILSCSDEGKSKKKMSPYEAMVYKGQQGEEVFIPSNDKNYISTLAFGSNNMQDSSQFFWQSIAMNKPDVWIWAGNAISFPSDSSYLPELFCSYRYLQENDAYQAFASTVPNLIGIWNDSEFGIHNNLNLFRNKDYTKSLFHDFVYLPKSASIRSRNGLYASYSAGEEGKIVKVILLDTKYFRDFSESSSEQGFNKNDDILGTEQWQWLEEIIKHSNADLNIFVSSYSFLDSSESKFSWSHFPQSKERLFELMSIYKLKNPLLLSGSMTSGEIRSINFENKKMFELSSGAFFSSQKHYLQDSTLDFSKNNNYGLVKINWDDFKPIISLQIKTLGNLTVKELSYKLE